jgi:hypothetical protein
MSSARIPVPEGFTKRTLGAAYQPEMTEALDHYQAAVVRLRAIDPAMTELVRLRCARYHDCHL